MQAWESDAGALQSKKEQKQQGKQVQDVWAANSAEGWLQNKKGRNRRSRGKKAQVCGLLMLLWDGCRVTRTGTRAAETTKRDNIHLQLRWCRNPGVWVARSAVGCCTCCVDETKSFQCSANLTWKVAGHG